MKEILQLKHISKEVWHFTLISIGPITINIILIYAFTPVIYFKWCLFVNGSIFSSHNTFVWPYWYWHIYKRLLSLLLHASLWRRNSKQIVNNSLDITFILLLLFYYILMQWLLEEIANRKLGIYQVKSRMVFDLLSSWSVFEQNTFTPKSSL